MSDLANAKKLLQDNGLTCALVKADKIHTSTERGIRPLLALIDAAVDLRGFAAADRIVGKAAALLYARMGVTALYAAVASESALAVLAAHGIAAQCDLTAPHIVNRRGDGLCPMEQAVAATDDPAAAPALLKARLAALQK